MVTIKLDFVFFLNKYIQLTLRYRELVMIINSMTKAVDYLTGHEAVADELSRLEEQRKQVGVPCDNTTSLPHLSISTADDIITLHSATSTATIHASPATLPPLSPSITLPSTSPSSTQDLSINTPPSTSASPSSPYSSSLSSSQSSLSSHTPQLLTPSSVPPGGGRLVTSSHSLSVDYSSSNGISTAPQGDVFLRPSPRR